MTKRMYRDTYGQSHARVTCSMESITKKNCKCIVSSFFSTVDGQLDEGCAWGNIFLLWR